MCRVKESQNTVLTAKQRGEKTKPENWENNKPKSTLLKRIKVANLIGNSEYSARRIVWNRIQIHVVYDYLWVNGSMI